jgi:sigma-54 specific flagellar transcriptional regulator A
MIGSSSQILGTSKVIKELKNLITTVAASNATVLITGESGTGKELIARNLHSLSSRSKHKFIPVNCAAIPKDLIESELFGHRKGSFTGAISDRVGRFELANGGTLFLDEIGDLPSEVQVKLLRVIQERVVDPIGSLKPRPIDVRIISATHKDLESEINASRFREDLFYRLNVLPIHSAPLRERAEDIKLLINHFANSYKKNGSVAINIEACLSKAFQDYSWPGNIRELSNIVARLSTLFPGESLKYNQIPQIMLPTNMRSLFEPVRNEKKVKNPVEDIISLVQGDDNLKNEDNKECEKTTKPLKEKLAEFEKNLIQKALEESNGNVSKTAKLLSVQRTTLIEKINKYSINSS